MRVPSYRRHSSGNARVTINGKDHLLGQYGSPASREKYKRVIAEYKASRRSKAFGLKEPLIGDLMLAFIRYVNDYYKGTTQPARYKLALRPVKGMYCSLPPHEFGPRQFKAIRANWLEDTSRSRRYINEQMQIVARMVEWAVSEELMEPDQLIKIRAVKPLERGRTTAREPAPVKCVPLETVEAITIATRTRCCRSCHTKNYGLVTQQTRSKEQASQSWGPKVARYAGNIGADQPDEEHFLQLLCKG